MSTDSQDDRATLLEQQVEDMFERHGPVKLLIDPEGGRIVRANQAAATFYGWSIAELERMTIADLNQLPAELVAREMELARAEQRNSFEFKHRLKSGELRDVQVHSGPCRVEGRTLLFSTIIDITERNRLAEQLGQAQRMEALGLLAGGVAHDVNNLLTTVAMLTAVLERRNPGVSAAELADLRAVVARGGAMTSRLLAFCRRQVRRTTLLDAAEEASNVRELLVRYGAGRVAIELEHDGPVPLIADRGQLEQVLLNLGMNAIDAMPEGGTVTVTLRPCTLAPGAAGGVAPGDYLEIVVRDTGVGIPPEHHGRIFEPFFTTREAGGRGSGLGLSTVYGIVQQNGGAISLESQPGHGAVFRILWPAPKSPEAVAGPRGGGGGEPAVAGRGEVVLLAEDEEANLAALGRLLTEAGYTVLRAPDGVAALAAAQRHPGEIHLLLTDLIMPRMGGRQLADALVAARPGIKVVYMSGHVDAVNRDLLDAGAHFLAKPFGIDELLLKLRQVLDAPARRAGV